MMRGTTIKLARSKYDGSFIVGKQRGDEWLVRGNDFTGEGDDVWKIGEEVDIVERFISDVEDGE